MSPGSKMPFINEAMPKLADVWWQHKDVTSTIKHDSIKSHFINRPGTGHSCAVLVHRHLWVSLGIPILSSIIILSMQGRFEQIGINKHVFISYYLLLRLNCKRIKCHRSSLKKFSHHSSVFEVHKWEISLQKQDHFGVLWCEPIPVSSNDICCWWEQLIIKLYRKFNI